MEDTTAKKMTFDEVLDKYKSVSDCPLEWEDRRVKDAYFNEPRRLWTMVDGDKGQSVLINGMHIVNRIGYYVTELPCSDEDVLLDFEDPDSYPSDPDDE